MLRCRGWITLTSLTDNLKAQNIAQTYPMDVLNGAKHPFFPQAGLLSLRRILLFSLS